MEKHCCDAMAKLNVWRVCFISISQSKNFSADLDLNLVGPDGLTQNSHSQCWAESNSAITIFRNEIKPQNFYERQRNVIFAVSKDSFRHYIFYS